MTSPENTHERARVGIILDIDDNPITLYIWAHLCAATLIEQLRAHCVEATLVRIDIHDRSDYPS
ncbi:MAG TPA: hypothetical protein VKQ71_12030 [Acidimicrobiales bacterium]|nr:hypothetical protein [Acidimicrobiales bacterium]